jgi:hypothetical protein
LVTQSRSASFMASLRVPAPAVHRPHLGAEHLHAQHVGLLPLDVGRAHEDHAGQPELGADRRGRDAVLAGAGLGDDARLAHALGQQDLAQAVVDLVRAGVVQVLALEVDLRAAIVRGQPLGEIERRRPAGSSSEVIHLGLERGIGLGGAIGALEIEDQRHQRLGDEAAAVDAEAALIVGAVPQAVGPRRRSLHLTPSRARRALSR